MASIIKVDTIQTAAGGTPTAADLGLNTTGSVLQVIHGKVSSQVTASTTAATNLNLSLSITPKSTSSKILLTCNLSAYLTGLDSGCGLIFYKDGSLLWAVKNNYDMYNDSDIHDRVRGTYTHLDTAGTTNQITYSVYGKQYSNSGVSYHNGGESMFTLMEIAG